MRALLLVLALLAAVPAQAACRMALALGLDVSGSVDGREYKLQMDGLADALSDPGVRDTLLQMPQAPVTLAVFEWSGPGVQRLLLDWTDITSDAALERVVTRLRGVGRVEGDPATALGEAKAYGAALLARRGDCWRQVLDISGDGKSNSGPRPQQVRPEGITVNGLVIGEVLRDDRGGTPGIGELIAYYRAYVIEGPGAFVETAMGFEAYREAMVRKLKKELQAMVIGDAGGIGPSGGSSQ